LAVVAAAAVPLVVAAGLVPLRTTLDNANVALLLAAVVVGVAMTGQRLASYVAALSAMVWFDFFHTKPYETFTITRHQDIVTAVVLLLVGVLVGELAIRGRRHWIAATERTDEITRIHRAAELVADGEPAEHVVMVVARELHDLLSLRDCRFDAGDHFVDERAIARLERNGDVHFGQFNWGVDKLGFPSDEVELLVQSQGQTFGRYVLHRTPGEPVPFERRVVAVALADQVGAAFAGRAAAASA
jgi:hypothetical protein